MTSLNGRVVKLERERIEGHACPDCTGGMILYRPGEERLAPECPEGLGPPRVTIYLPERRIEL